jgi:thiamine-monophosphate kinase
VRRACRPAPPLRAGVQLSRAAACRAAIDLSDGLADGVRRLAEASGCGATVDGSLVPIDPSARAICEALGLDPLATALSGGDDYELLFTVSRRHRGRFRAASSLLGTSITRIGVITEGPAVLIERPGREPQPLGGGFDHFQSA